MLGLPTEARAGLPIARTQLGEYDGGNGYGNAAKFYDELESFLTDHLFAVFL